MAFVFMQMCAWTGEIMQTPCSSWNTDSRENVSANVFLSEASGRIFSEKHWEVVGCISADTCTQLCWKLPGGFVENADLWSQSCCSSPADWILSWSWGPWVFQILWLRAGRPKASDVKMSCAHSTLAGGLDMCPNTRLTAGSWSKCIAAVLQQAAFSSQTARDISWQPEVWRESQVSFVSERAAVTHPLCGFCPKQSSSHSAALHTSFQEKPQEPQQPEAPFSIGKQWGEVFVLSQAILKIILQQKPNTDLIFSHPCWTEKPEANPG